MLLISLSLQLTRNGFRKLMDPSAEEQASCPKPVTLKHEAIPRAAIPNCTNHLSVVNTLRESGIDSACSIEGFQLFGGEFQIQTGEIVLELRYLPRSHDRDYWHCSMAQPRERDLRHAAANLFGD